MRDINVIRGKVPLKKQKATSSKKKKGVRDNRKFD